MRTEEILLPLRVNDIKQYLYCPRVVYYQYVMPVERKITHKMDHGKMEHLEVDRLEKRRKLLEYGLDQGERHFHVHLHSERLGLSGTLDLLLVSSRGYFPVDFKYSLGTPGLNHKYQLAAYCLLTSERFETWVRTGFLYMIPGKRIYPVNITDNVVLHLKRVMGAIRRMIREERMPLRNRSRGRCVDCEYRKFCADD